MNFEAMNFMVANGHRVHIANPDNEMFTYCGRLLMRPVGQQFGRRWRCRRCAAAHLKSLKDLRRTGNHMYRIPS
jgi:hypothetical protein